MVVLNFKKCSLVVAAVLITVSAYADEHFPFVGKINSEGINVRAGASTNYERIDQLSLNTSVIVLAHQYEWYQIQLLPTAQLFIRGDYLKAVGDGVAEVQGDRVNLRARPVSESAAVGQVIKGTLLKTKATQGQWVQVEAPKGVTGWVNQRFIVKDTDKTVESIIPPEVTLLPTTVKEKHSKESASAKQQAKVIQVVTVSVEGLIKPAQKPSVAGIKYQLFINNKPAYYLKHTLDLGKFSAHKVKVIGDFTPSVTDNELPVINVTDISLVM